MRQFRTRETYKFVTRSLKRSPKDGKLTFPSKPVINSTILAKEATGRIKPSLRFDEQTQGEEFRGKVLKNKTKNLKETPER